MASLGHFRFINGEEYQSQLYTVTDNERNECIEKMKNDGISFVVSESKYLAIFTKTAEYNKGLKIVSSIGKQIDIASDYK
ncbi:unnamed protein product [Cunninghamella echinulata]